VGSAITEEAVDATQAPATATQGEASATGEGERASGGTRLIKHALGETRAPAEPRRVVALLSAADVALAVGVKPIAVDDSTAKSEYLRGRLEGVENIGQASEPNLEKLATLKPDLIVALDVVIEDVYDELSRIAPTVGVRFGEASGEWKRYNREYAEAMGKGEEFERAMAGYQARARAFRAAMGDRLKETEVAVMRASPENLRFDLPGIFIGDVVYNDAGLRLPPGLRAYHEREPRQPTLEISREQFRLAEGSDALFTWNVTGTGTAEDDRRQAAEMLQDPVFRTLDVVKRGDVHQMGDHWFSESILGANLVLADLEKRLAAGDGAPSAASYPITVKHDGGETTLQKPPSRVVVLGDEMAEIALALGVRPVGYASSRLQSASLGSPVARTTYLDPALLGQPTFAGSNLEPSLETIVALKPDLVLYLHYDQKIYESLARIAPTVAFNVQPKRSWQRALRETGRALERSERAEAIIREFDGRLQELRAGLAPVAQRSPRVVALYLPSPETTMVFDDRFTLAGLFTDLGFELTGPPGVRMGPEGLAEVSAESLAGLNADQIVAICVKGAGDQEQFQAETVLSTLRAPTLRYFIDPERPYTGPYSEPRFLEDFAALLLGKPVAAVTRDERAAASPAVDLGPRVGALARGGASP
jgi:iron complex transport system substrate-binding protein